jgi:hypothetical protein
MRFYILPADEGQTTYINFDHVTSIRVTGPTIELYFVGVETPMVIAKNATTLSTIGKGMDLSDTSKESLSRL